MGARASLRRSNNTTKNQSEDQAIAALLLVISKNVSLMEKLVDQIDTREDINELKNQLNESQNHILKLIKEATTDIEQLASLDNSELMSPTRQHPKQRQEERLRNELKTAVEKFQSVQRLAAERGESMIRKKKQEMKNETQTISALILIISEKVHSMKKIVNQLSSKNPEKSKNPENLLNQLGQLDHYTGLLIDDASDCIKKQAENMIAAESSGPDEQLHSTIQLADELSTLKDIDNLLKTVQRLDIEKQNVMTKVNEFETMIQHKNG